MCIVEFEGWLFSSELCGCDKEVTYDCGEGNVYSTGIESEFGNSNGGKRDMITLAMGNQAERFIPAFLFLVANDQKKVLGSARALTISHVLVDVFFSCMLRYPCFRT
ncbi:hypothetical protein NC652_038490 [Populus alba x Populus x berolinensis]|nr:hypothetical protein NC652_038490 [Populus alba x Populus x berolinensis]